MKSKYLYINCIDIPKIWAIKVNIYDQGVVLEHLLIKRRNLIFIENNILKVRIVAIFEE